MTQWKAKKAYNREFLYTTFIKK